MSLAVRTLTYKLLYLVTSDDDDYTESTSCEFYELAKDRWEQSPLSGLLTVVQAQAKSSLLNSMNTTAGGAKRMCP